MKNDIDISSIPPNKPNVEKKTLYRMITKLLCRNKSDVMEMDCVNPTKGSDSGCSTDSSDFSASDGVKYSHVPSTSIKDEINRSKQKSTFMTNYTLIDGLRTHHMKSFMNSQSPNGKSVNRFPVKCFAGHSKRGFSSTNKTRKNQDALIMAEIEDTQSLILACMDGHGQYGDAVSQAIKTNFEDKLHVHSKFSTDIKSAISEIIDDTEQNLNLDTGIDCSISGSTFIMAIIRGTRLTVANIGDSRAIIISKVYGKYKARALSIEHKPEIDEEKERILAAGGRVFGIKYPDGILGPQRVWKGDADLPGLAMSRSIGDSIIHQNGVISTPTFMEHEINPREDIALVIASDGLWNVLSDNEIVRHVTSSREPSAAVGLLLRESHNQWVKSADSIDDTTIAVAFFYHQ
eukprot:gene11254-23547_t